MKVYRRVVILYKFLPQYRKPFFELLKQRLDKIGINLVLIYGDGGFQDRTKKDLVQIAWAHFIPNKIINIWGYELYWQPALKHIYDSDLIIVEQASKLLINYYIQILQVFKLSKIAFWGHGRNFQAKRNNILAEIIKKIVSRYASWWFAYNTTSQKIVCQLGFPKHKITVVQNSIDTQSLKNYLSQISEQDRQKIKNKYGFSSNNICVFCGGMYKDKYLDFLFKATNLIKQKIPDFQLVLIGAGVEKSFVEKIAEKNDWIYYLGPLFDKDKVEIFSVSKLYLMPGLVGLGILDSFALAVPLVTTDIPIHSPEIEYLENHVNGVMTRHDVNEYANVVVSLLADEHKYQLLKSAALRSSEKYSVEDMVENFIQGILSAIGVNENEKQTDKTF